MYGQRKKTRARKTGKRVPGRARITRDAKTGYFTAELRAGGEVHGLGSWRSERDAAIACDRAARFLQVEGYVPKVPGCSAPAPPVELRRAAASRSGSPPLPERSRYLGVRPVKGGWRATVRIEGRRRRIGVFATALEAAEMRDRLVRYYGAASGQLNFPHRRLGPKSFGDAAKEAPAGKGPASHYLGVCRTGSKKPWRVVVADGRSSRSAGYWATEEDAALAYDRAALWYQGEAATLNFPERRRKLKPASVEMLAAERWAARKKRTHSRFFGVTRAGTLWLAQTSTRPQVRLGVFKSEVAAARAIDRYTKAKRLKNPRWNFDPVTDKRLYGERPFAQPASATAPKREGKERKKTGVATSKAATARTSARTKVGPT
jgi:hypothetical protein